MSHKAQLRTARPAPKPRTPNCCEPDCPRPAYRADGRCKAHADWHDYRVSVVADHDEAKARGRSTAI
jgi:hypothetical protein